MRPHFSLNGPDNCCMSALQDRHVRRARGVLSVTSIATRVCGCLLASWLAVGAAAAEPPVVIDDFADASRWSMVVSDGVVAECRERRDEACEAHSSALRLDIDFVAGAGYAGIRRELPLDLPANFELTFSIRGDLPPNNLELKLVDETGSNVWWVNRRAFEFSDDWTRLTSRRRHFQFAWGPSGAPLARISAIEIVVASAEGGRGTVLVDDLTFRSLPAAQPYAGPPEFSAISQADASSAPPFAGDADAHTMWQSAPGDRTPTLTVDFGVVREFNGLVINWDATAYAAGCDVQLSEDGRSWTTVRRVGSGGGRAQYVALPDSEARAVRLVMAAPPEHDCVAIRELEILPLEAARDANAFMAEIAHRSPPGYYPRAFQDGGEGSTFWTVIGAPDDDREALISEDGAVEVDKRAFSIEPFLYVDGRLLTWADASITQSLAAGHAPVPTVTRAHDGLTLSVTAAVDGQSQPANLLLLYTVSSTSPEPVGGVLYLTIRPLQVNPPYQWLNTVGGVARIDRIAMSNAERTIEVDDRRIWLANTPDAFGSATFDEGDVTTFISRRQVPPHPSVVDSQRAASAAIGYEFELDGLKSRSWALCVPMSQDSAEADQSIESLLEVGSPVEYVRRRQQAMVDWWTRATSTFDLVLPAEATDITNAIRTTLAHILINSDGAAIHPGSRSYERSWIRDGALTSAALLRFGLERKAREFVDWYAQYQYDSGKVPCVVDRRGPDPTPENDSHGQFIMAVMNVYRFTGDKEFLRTHWPRVEKAVAYIESLRGQRMTTEYTDPDATITRQEPGKPAVNLNAFYGLVPESISHEGYSAKPMHSYWDDFFTLRGLKDAAEMARILNHEVESSRYRVLADDFAQTLDRSIDLAMQAHRIDYIPGCVELGDFDATSTTVALWPCGELDRLPRPALDRTFDLYWDRFIRRRDDPSFAWTDYTPYEMRCVGSLVLLGEVDRAHEALEYFMNDRRPRAWNQWPEVVYRAPRTARFVGDLPHTWCGSDFLNSVRMLFLFERESDDALVLLAGVPRTWISSEPIGFRNMPTYGGRMSCTIARAGTESGHLTAQLTGDCPLPSGGVRLTCPLGPLARATVNGRAAEIDSDGRVVVRGLPAEVELHLAPIANQGAAD